MNSSQATRQVTDEQIKIFHLVLQVYCSPSLKEHLHNPVMTLLACKMERTGSFLCAQGVVCVCVCVGVCVWVCVWVGVHKCICIFVRFICMGVWLCVHVH